MTIGQRIAQKRKDLALSQEALGDRLGVSRQSIYKWESDAALPEIDKLIALSKLFGVSVGWLLGVEDAQPESDSPEAESSANGELTEPQLQIVEEIVGRYLAAQPISPRRRRALKIAVIAGALCLVGGLYSFSAKLDQLNSRYNALQSEINQVEQTVGYQVYGISEQVEELLKSQNALTADYSTEMTARDLTRNTITFSLRAVPKTYTDGMTAVFLADSGDGPTEFPADLSPGRAFTCEASVTLTDNITLSVVFASPDGTRSTQLLDTYNGLYSETMPFVDPMDDLIHTPLPEPGLFKIPAPNNAPVRYILIDPTQKGSVPAIRELRVGLFKNKTLVAWAEPCEMPDSFHGFDQFDAYALPDLELPLTAEDELCTAAILTDEYGRTILCPGTPCVLDADGESMVWPSGGITLDFDLSHWTFS
jgi:transcriptional regulator with XRE-family HTH domain